MTRHSHPEQRTRRILYGSLLSRLVTSSAMLAITGTVPLSCLVAGSQGYPVSSPAIAQVASVPAAAQSAASALYAVWKQLAARNTQASGLTGVPLTTQSSNAAHGSYGKVYPYVIVHRN